MKLTPEQLEAELLQLPPAVRARLAEALLDSLEEADTETDLAWADEAERRYQELKAGAVKGVPVADALATARTRLNEPR
jgi:putative addiction module component (TIGR02574 family)